MKNTNYTNNLYKIISIINTEEWRKNPKLNEIKKLLNEYIKIRVVKKGEKIHNYNKEENQIHYVILGKYFNYRELKIGKRNLVSLNKSPEWIGIDRILCPEYANITEDTVIEECTVIDIDKEYFIKSLKEEGELSIHIIKNLLKKMSIASNRAEYMLINDAKEQVLYWIREYWENYNNNKNELIIELKNEYIADNIGISARTLYRVLKELRENKLISNKKGNIVIDKFQINKIKEELQI